MKNIITRTRVGFLIGILLGAAIWWASPHVAGEMEPWDATGPYYPLALFIAGLLAAFVDPQRFWISAIGIYIGQFLYAIFFLPGGPLWLLGLLSGAMFLLCALFGGLIPHGIWLVLKHRKKQSIEQGGGEVRS